MSQKVLEQFQTSYPDPDNLPILPSDLTDRLGRLPDYGRAAAGRKLSRRHIATYNKVYKDKGKEAADNWLNELWMS